MTVCFDHTIVRVHDKQETAEFYAEVLDLAPATPNGPFLDLRLGNGAALSFADTEGAPVAMHYAFGVSEDDFDAVLDRIRRRDLPYWADPFCREPNAINHDDGGRGVYWMDPNGHLLEVITRRHGFGA